MTIDEKLEKLADSLIVTNGIVVRLENGLNSLTVRVNSLTEAVARFMEATDRTLQAVEGTAARLDDAITKLAAAQLVTEEKLQGLIDALRRSGNGTR